MLSPMCLFTVLYTFDLLKVEKKFTKEQKIPLLMKIVTDV